MGAESLSGYIILHASTVCQFVNMPNEEILAEVKAPVTIERGGACNAVKSGTFNPEASRTQTRITVCNLSKTLATSQETRSTLLSGLPSSRSSKILTLVVG